MVRRAATDTEAVAGGRQTPYLRQRAQQVGLQRGGQLRGTAGAHGQGACACIWACTWLPSSGSWTALLHLLATRCSWSSAPPCGSRSSAPPARCAGRPLRCALLLGLRWHANVGRDHAPAAAAAVMAAPIAASCAAHLGSQSRAIPKPPHLLSLCLPGGTRRCGAAHARRPEAAALPACGGRLRRVGGPGAAAHPGGTRRRCGGIADKPPRQPCTRRAEPGMHAPCGGECSMPGCRCLSRRPQARRHAARRSSGIAVEPSAGGGLVFVENIACQCGAHADRWACSLTAPRLGQQSIAAQRGVAWGGRAPWQRGMTLSGTCCPAGGMGMERAWGTWQPP